MLLPLYSDFHNTFILNYYKICPPLLQYFELNLRGQENADEILAFISLNIYRIMPSFSLFTFTLCHMMFFFSIHMKQLVGCQEKTLHPSLLKSISTFPGLWGIGQARMFAL